MKQFTHFDFKSENHDLDIVVVCDGLNSPANIGGVLRVADAFGVSEVVFLSEKKKMTPRAKSVSRGTEKFVPHSFVEKFDFDNRDWFCLEFSSISKSIGHLKLNSKKIGLIVGNENEGVQEKFLADFPNFHIDMYGKNSSMNVTNALSIALFKVTCK
ncbi:MAG: hypothetical protein CMP67_05315 [Flavobacteriales bacterium]|nr:hypothetical protein [Flavobacteriales bacterium]|tara:strand:+ start:1010 stop:1480 length:471 start_codon:yes stop_codon:yes gene_type:complete